MNEDLAIMDQTALAVSRAPEMVLDEAHDAAKALKRVIEGKPNKVMFGGEQYLEFEDWQTVGRFYGIAPRIVSTKFVEYGTAEGWEARAEAVHVPTGRVVSSADAMCLNDEEKWSARPKYAYVYHKKSGGTSVEDPGPAELIWEKQADGKSRPKKERMLVGTEQVPQFQLRSMAQTRAAAKALRNALAWVVVLAGYRPTPAEEMDAMAERKPNEESGGRPPSAAGGEGPVRPATTAPTIPTETVEEEGNRLFPDEPTAEEIKAKKDTLLGRISGGFDLLKLSAAQRVVYWDKHCHGATFMTAEPEVVALDALYTELRRMHEAAKSREKKG